MPDLGQIFGIPWPCYRGHLGPSGPKLEIESENVFPGREGPKKSKTESKKSQIDCFSTILTLFRLHFRLFGPRGREAPGTHFGLFFQLWARRA